MPSSRGSSWPRYQTTSFSASPALQVGSLRLSHQGNPKVTCAAAAAKSLQSCPALCNPIDSSPPGSPIPGILQVRTLEWVAISSSNAWKWKLKVKSLSHVWLLVTPWTAAYEAPLSMGFSRQEYWSGVPLPSPVLIMRSHLILIYLPEVQSPNTITLGSRASTHEFSGETTQSTAVGNWFSTGYIDNPMEKEQSLQK